MRRLPKYLRISVTDRCNLHCLYCRPSGVSPERGFHTLTCSQVVNFVSSAAACGIEKVRLTGGEPLVHEEIVEIVRRVSQVQGVRSLGLTTNGHGLAQLARPLREAGLQRVNISLPSLRPESYRRITGGSLRAATAGFDAALREQYPAVKLNVVVLRGINDAEIEQLAALAQQASVEVRFIEYMPFCTIPGVENPLVPASEVLERLRSLGELSIDHSGEAGSSAIRFSVAGFRGRVALIAPMTRPFCAACGRIRLTANGRLRACLVDGGEVDARPALNNGADPQLVRTLLEKAMSLKPARHNARFSGVMTCIGG